MTTAEKKRVDRQIMCNRLAMEFEDGWVAQPGRGHAHPLLQLRV